METLEYISQVAISVMHIMQTIGKFLEVRKAILDVKSENGKRASHEVERQQNTVKGGFYSRGLFNRGVFERLFRFFTSLLRFGLLLFLV